MKKIFGILAAALAFVLVATSVRAVDTLEEVSGDTSAGYNQPGWLFNRDPANVTPFEFNTDQASIGDGSLYVMPIGATAADKFIGENFINSPIADISSISYDFLIAGDGVEADKVHFYMNVYANFGVSDDLKFYDCRYDVVPTVGSTGAFTTVTFDPTQVYSVTQSGSSPGTCPAIPADMDDTSLGSNIRMFVLNVGDTSASDEGLGGYLDNVVVSMANADTTTYDFEPEEEEVFTKADILIGSGIEGTGLSTAPGLMKPFNPNSKAAEHAGKKN
jgi:hypothetical protein